MVSYKTIALANELADKLNRRLNGALTFTVTPDTDNYPVLKAGSGVAGAENVILKLTNYLAAQNAAAVAASKPSPYLDELGLAASPFSPSIAQLTTEAASGSGLGAGAKATSTITISGGADLESAVIGGTTVSVTWGTSDNATATALAAAITADVKANKLVTAVASTNTVIVTALPGLGTAGNSIGLTVTGTGMSATGAGYLAGGTTAGGAGSTHSMVKLADLSKVMGDMFAQGTIVEMYLSAAGTAPSTSNGTLVATYSTSTVYPGVSNN